MVCSSCAVKALTMIETEFDGTLCCPSTRKKSFEERLLSFKNWRGNVSPVDLAKTGFYFTGYEDICCCAFCGLEICEWEADDCPLMEHIKFGKCPFAQVLLVAKAYRNASRPKKNCKYIYVLHVLLVLTTYFIVFKMF